MSSTNSGVKNPFELWQLPKKESTSYVTGLHVRNSLKPNELVEFIPHKGKQIRFYNCGPTVYDSSHLGHARTYISADMIRKILLRYFNYDVFYCMNITDVDDKIISESNSLGEDFKSFARRWEIDYWQDMEALNIDKPDVIVRVSEYIDEIIKYTQKIIENGFAYESNGSVYFSVESFHANEHHCYAKLEPQSANNKKKLEEGEGALGSKDESEKRSPKDFALWKLSKPGEPKWASPWGEGRPGWHIECSTMASEILGYPVDIHMGGEDLKFPHHDNEMAQSEAYYNNCEHQNQWVNYFMHTGHLHIEGLKMSKSLKNFITIKNLISSYNPRHLRLLFMKQNYDSTMDYSADSIKEAGVKDKRFTEFFRTVNAVLLKAEINVSQKWTQREFELRDLLEEKQAKVHQHFQKNFNVPEVISEIDDLVTAINVYLKTRPYIHLIIVAYFNYIKHIFYCVGLNYEESVPQLKQGDAIVKVLDLVSSFRDSVRGNLKDFGAVQAAIDVAKTELIDASKGSGSTSEQSLEAVVIANRFIERVQVAVNEKQLNGLTKACDLVRDEDLIAIGIRIDDGRPGEPSSWKVEDREVLLREIEEKVLREQEKEREKRSKEQEKLKAMSVNPKELFIHDPAYAKYSFDENGIPSHDEKGQPLKEKALASFQKKWDAQKKLYDQYLVQSAEQVTE